jgi:hypothetical protein
MKITNGKIVNEIIAGGPCDKYNSIWLPGQKMTISYKGKDKTVVSLEITYDDIVEWLRTKKEILWKIRKGDKTIWKLRGLKHIRKTDITVHHDKKTGKLYFHPRAPEEYDRSELPFYCDENTKIIKAPDFLKGRDPEAYDFWGQHTFKVIPIELNRKVAASFFK